MLEDFFSNQLAQNTVYAKNIDEYLKIQVSGKVAQPVLLVQLISNQDGE